MKNFTLIFLIPLFLSLSDLLHAQSPEWRYLRPSNTGLGGDYQQCIEVDRFNNKWSGGYLPFWSQGSVSRFDDSIWTCWSNFEGYLPADRVYDVAFDNNDGLWVATNGVGYGIASGGIAHYDGTTWTQYTSLNTPMPEDDMRGIVVDHNNVVWSTFMNVQNGVGGVAKFDGDNWTIYTPSNSGLQSSQVDKIDVDAQNNIWIGTNLGLVKFDGLNWILYTTQNSDISSNNVTDVEVDEVTNKVYAATGIAIDVFDGTAFSHINSTNAPISGTGLWAVDAHGDSLVIGTLGGSGLAYVYDGNTWTSHLEPYHCYDVRIDHKGIFWICGIGFLEKYDGSVWTHYDSFNTGLVSMFNNEIFIDSDNRAWFGSSDDGGISMFDCPFWEDYNPYNSFNFPQPIDYTGYATGIAEDSYGDIWMVYNGVAGGVVQIPNGDVHDTGAWKVWENINSGISLQFLNRAAGDLSGNLWVGYDQACSVSKYSHLTDSWTNYNLFQLGQITCGAGSGINSIRVDALNNVWVCGLAGLAKYDQNNWTFYSYLNTPMLQGAVYDIAFDANGNEWIGTEHGLYKFDGVNWTLYNHTNTPLYGDVVKSTLVDKNNVLWVGAGDENYPYPSGLFSFDGTTWNTFSTTNSGLPEKYVERLSQDTLGNLWVLTTSQGCAVYQAGGVKGFDCIDQSLQGGVATYSQSYVPSNKNSFDLKPNPAFSNVVIDISLSQAASVVITIASADGRILKDFSEQYLTKGQHQIVFDLSGLPSGIYFCTMKSPAESLTQKFIKK